MTLQHTFKTVIRLGGIVIPAQAGIQMVANLKEVVELHLDGEDLAEFGLAPNPTIVITYELEPGIAAA